MMPPVSNPYVENKEGYLNPLYARSFSDFGEPLYLKHSKGWAIKRKIPNTPYYDAMGTYPLFFCEDWHGLSSDFDALKNDLLSITFVVDPFTEPYLDKFKYALDIFTPFKEHYLLDLSSPLEETISENKRRNSKRALRKLHVELDIAPTINLQEWLTLYGFLIKRHHINDIRAFSPSSFAHQISIPNTHFFKAIYKGRIVGGNLFYIQGDIAYAHLSAFTDEGYELGAAYAIKWIAVNYFTDKVKWINFGGGTGQSGDKNSGLDLFKSGWSNITRKSYLCGKILDRTLYENIVIKTNTSESKWFPAYREGEFT
jgi:hypothetical protein